MVPLLSLQNVHQLPMALLIQINIRRQRIRVTLSHSMNSTSQLSRPPQPSMPSVPASDMYDMIFAMRSSTLLSTAPSTVSCTCGPYFKMPTC